MNNFTKRTKILLGIFIIVTVFGLSALLEKSREVDEILENTTLEPTPTAQSAPVKKPVATTAQISAQTYTNLVKEYEGRRVQFDMNCQAIPSSVTYKNGTKVLLDNRSGDSRIITVGGVQYSLAGYGYRILTLTSSTLPKTLLLSCGSAVNVGQILLQS